MKNGSFQNMCKQIYCNESVIVGREIVENGLQKVLENLEISTWEFCQMINYDTTICEHCWAHCVKVNTLKELFKCLKEESEKKMQRLIDEITGKHGIASEINDLTIIRTDAMENVNLDLSDKVEKIFKCFFVACLMKASEEEIYSLHKHITGENHTLGCNCVSIDFRVCEITPPPNFMNAHTCFNELDLMIHTSQLDTILSSFEMFRESVNSQFAGVAHNDS